MSIAPQSPTLHDAPLRPNFLFIGTSKAGSTWIFNLLSLHSQIAVAHGKGLYYFDSHFDRGDAWYLKHFRHAVGARVVGEVSHSYLYSAEACRRIAEFNPHMKLMVCLREPVDRCFSAYLDGVKNGRFCGSFAEALRADASLSQRSHYAPYLAAYLEQFGRAQLHCAVFDDLRESPQAFAHALFDFLSVEPLSLPAHDQRAMMPAARPRSRAAVNLAKRASRALKRIGLKRVKGRLKRSRAIRNLLYSEFDAAQRPRPEQADRQRLRREFRDDVRRLDEMLGLNLCQRWGYSPDADGMGTSSES